MRNDLYFEQDPWTRACECIRTQELGSIVQISIQCVCGGGQLEEQRKKWEGRVQRLAGAPVRLDVLEAGKAVSLVGVFGNEVIVRLFFDEAAEAHSENFEIVTEKALIVWKPGCVNQGHMLAENGCFLEASQRYTVNLGVTTC